MVKLNIVFLEDNAKICIISEKNKSLKLKNTKGENLDGFSPQYI